VEASKNSFVSAINDFRAARNRAVMKEILAQFSGESTQLLSFDEVREKLKVLGSSDLGLQDIPLDAIIGSAGRYAEFTRDFLPRQDIDEQRWARILAATQGPVGLPPIEVYKIGEVYFVKDGNHRVSVARQLGATHIQAYVTEIRTRVPLSADVRPEDLILKAEYADFLERTRLNELRPTANLEVTEPGQYSKLLEHISVHRYFMGLEQKRYIPYGEAVEHWYESVYLPIVEVIHTRGILRSFPGRTETDLYLWIAEHRAEMEKALGWKLSPAAAASDLVEQSRPQPERVVSRLGEKFLESISLDKLEPGPPPGEWRKEKSDAQEERLIEDILVSISGLPSGWIAVDQALVVAQREGAHLHGLHVLASEEEHESQAAREMQELFNHRCAAAGVEGELAFGTGEISRQICNRARWTDLIVTSLVYPPAPQPLARLGSGFRDMIQRCPRPLLAVPQTFSPLNRALLAYDGSPKAEEALYIATYLCGRWQIPLVVACVAAGTVSARTLDSAREYIETCGITADYVLESGPVAETILQIGKAQQCDFLIMGGYGYSPVIEVVLGSTVDQVLRECYKPMLICR
jgi:nucleotide-binding universal stress UspA family protein